jgi:hypothetical protein
VWQGSLGVGGGGGLRAWLVIGVLALLSFAAFRGCFGGASTSWNQRLTLVVETPQGEVRGAAVTKVGAVDFSGPLVLAEARGPKSTVQGEAVAVEVLPGKWLFALIGGAENPAGNATAWAEVSRRGQSVAWVLGACGRHPAPALRHAGAAVSKGLADAGDV